MPSGRAWMRLCSHLKRSMRTLIQARPRCLWGGWKGGWGGCLAYLPAWLACTALTGGCAV